MKVTTLESEDGYRLVYRPGGPGENPALTVDGLRQGQEVTFRGSLPPEAIVAQVPAHVGEEARRRGATVCGYDPHCMTCFCDDDGNMTCVPIC